MVTRNPKLLSEPTYKSFAVFNIRVDDTIEDINTFRDALTECESATSMTLFDASSKCLLNEEFVNALMKSGKLQKLTKFEILSDHCNYSGFPKEFEGYLGEITSNLFDGSLHNRLLILPERPMLLKLEQQRAAIEKAIDMVFAPTPRKNLDTEFETTLSTALHEFSFVAYLDDDLQMIYLSNDKR